MEKTKREIRKEKKAYEKPRIVYQQSLEATAAACPAPGKAVLPCNPIES
jgi:hypothetical protein